ncbi:hypothetical protein PHLCEN_2v320 [Hermanssonia centrifuga]|uniref:Uncharacterized protein n=1 Tax=Hermanssonia centrifuga TaxID=98765 RepID=A0A2R6S6F9_9APHY|nr:hypothetical protein PHLCEN_2v320 [Hermanssonia centrifuga]
MDFSRVASKPKKAQPPPEKPRRRSSSFSAPCEHFRPPSRPSLDPWDPRNVKPLARPGVGSDVLHKQPTPLFPFPVPELPPPYCEQATFVRKPQQKLEPLRQIRYSGLNGEEGTVDRYPNRREEHTHGLDYLVQSPARPTNEQNSRSDSAQPVSQLGPSTSRRDGGRRGSFSSLKSSPYRYEGSKHARLLQNVQSGKFNTLPYDQSSGAGNPFHNRTPGDDPADNWSDNQPGSTPAIEVLKSRVDSIISWGDSERTLYNDSFSIHGPTYGSYSAASVSYLDLSGYVNSPDPEGRLLRGELHQWHASSSSQTPTSTSTSRHQAPRRPETVRPPPQPLKRSPQSVPPRAKAIYGNDMSKAQQGSQSWNKYGIRGGDPGLRPVQNQYSKDGQETSMSTFDHSRSRNQFSSASSALSDITTMSYPQEVRSSPHQTPRQTEPVRPPTQPPKGSPQSLPPKAKAIYGKNMPKAQQASPSGDPYGSGDSGLRPMQTQYTKDNQETSMSTSDHSRSWSQSSSASRALSDVTTMSYPLDGRSPSRDTRGSTVWGVVPTLRPMHSRVFSESQHSLAQSAEVGTWSDSAPEAGEAISQTPALLGHKRSSTTSGSYAKIDLERAIDRDRFEIEYKPSAGGKPMSSTSPLHKPSAGGKPMSSTSPLHKPSAGGKPVSSISPSYTEVNRAPAMNLDGFEVEPPSRRSRGRR